MADMAPRALLRGCLPLLIGIATAATAQRSTPVPIQPQVDPSRPDWENPAIFAVGKLPARGDFVAVTKGLSDGQQIVSEGAFKLRNGAAIVVDNSVKPTPELDPHPPNR